MGTINWYFTEEEMISFLERKGYFIETITSWYSEHKYHHGDDMEYIDVEIKIAYTNGYEHMGIPPNRPNEMIEEGRKYDLEYNYGIKTVFEKLMHKALLNL